MTTTLRDGSQVEDPRLNRIPFYDPRSLDYPVRTLLNEEAPVVTKLWSLPPTDRTRILDQGQEGACVGFGATNELRFYPVPILGLDNTFAREQIYWQAQRDDPWNGGSYPGAAPRYEGTSVLAGVKAAAKLGFYGSYHWAMSEAEIARAICQIGPVILGLTWRRDMQHPDSKGYIHYSGDPVGGHCILAIGINARSNYYTLQNSWGASWGSRGTCKISRADLAKAMLKANKGEACVVTERFDPQKPGKTAKAGQ